MIKLCQECGLKFEASNGNQKFCNREHYRVCKVCGNKFVVTRYHLTAKDAKVTCSRKCSSELRKLTNIERYGGVAPASSQQVRDKMAHTNLARYGVAHAAQSEDIKSKMKKTNMLRYGVNWYLQSDKGRQAISDSWKDEEAKSERLDKIASTNMAKYGCISSLGNSDVRNSAHQTYFDRTGYYEPLSNPAVQSKIESTNTQRYGVKRPLQDESIRRKWMNTNLERYGYENPMQCKDIMDRVKSTCLARYGNTCFLQSDLGRKLTESFMFNNHNKRWFSQTDDWKISRMLDPSKLEEFLKFKDDPKKYISDNYSDKPSIRIISIDVGVHENTVGQILAEKGAQEYVKYVYSYMENDLFNFLKSLDSSLNIDRNTHSVITPLELDLYLPDYNIGIECNPTSTHNSSINTFDVHSTPMKYDYHLMKTKKCEDAGIFLFHIFGSEWTYSRHIIESMIRNLLGRCERTVYARKCQVKEVDWSTCRDFLNNNHRQGNANSKVRLGLYLEDELVSVMTFGKMRNTIGTDGTDLSDCWELVRFCSLLNTSVVGGASKLFKHFIKSYNPVRVRSFSDRAHTRGGLYEKLGFKKISESDPGYVWVDSRTDISYHRYNAQKQNIKQFLHDDTIDLSKTEKQIMEEHGFLQVFDSGTLLWEWCTDTAK